MNYRSEIDGLRALAVVPVILFHAGFEIFGGGFIGVDIFFVISGYLITTIILKEHKEGKFSIINFYVRRARRILPGLYFVMLFSIPFAWFLLLPSDLKDFAESLLAVSLFMSNILFWRESGYFENASELKPLLHTWSLAVEEQFYFLFPLFLLILWRFGKLTMLTALLLILIFSFGLGQWASINKPVAAFFLLPTRCWELLIGVLIAVYLSSDNSKKFTKSASEVCAWLGIALLLYAIFTFSKVTPFPGIYALIPSLGTALIIVFATKSTSVGKILSNKVFVGIGLISYSAYLWHQPTFAFARHKFSNDLSLSYSLFLIVFILMMSILSWKFIETPFRKNNISKGRVFIYSFIGIVFFLLIAGVVIKHDGFVSRFESEQQYILSFNKYNYKEIYREKDCFLKPEQTYTDFKVFCYPDNVKDTILVWGDSHAAAISFGLRNNLETVGQYTASGCPPLLGMSSKWSPNCEAINKYISKEVQIRKPKAIILHANWLLYDKKNISINLLETIDWIKEKSPNTEIIIIGGVPQYDPTLPIYILRKQMSLDDLVIFASGYDKVHTIDKLLEELSFNSNVRFFSSLHNFCFEKNCIFAYKFEDYLMPVQWDYGHLTAAGSNYLANKFYLFYMNK